MIAKGSLMVRKMVNYWARRKDKQMAKKWDSLTGLRSWVNDLGLRMVMQKVNWKDSPMVMNLNNFDIFC